MHIIYVQPMCDLPGEFRCELPYVEEELGPFGAKTILEISTNGAAPAIAIAIHCATGVWMRGWPFSAQRVYKALQDVAMAKV